MTWPTIIIWFLIAWAAFTRGPFILYLFAGTVIFGALTMAPPGLTGGLNLPAQTICAAILIVKILLRADNLRAAIALGLDVRKLGLLGFFIIFAVVTSFLLPRLFRGDVLIYSLNEAASESPLAPTSANFTQVMYLLISVGITFAFAVAGRAESFRTLYMRSIVVAGTMLVLSGLANLALNMAGGLALLQPFHNAAYASLDTVSIAGQYRVVGLMPEASVYGAACCTVLSFLVFNFRYFEAGLVRFAIPLLIFALIMMIILSTSSTGYIGLIVLGLGFFGRLAAETILVPLRSQKQLRRGFAVVAGMMLLVAVLLFIGPILFAKYQTLLNTVLFNKTTSGSYYERSRWSAAGLQAFFATYGFGVGVGSVRTSSWFVNLLASTGLIGAGLFGCFVLRMLFANTGGLPAADRRFANSLKLSLLPTAVMIGISSTTPDPGVWVMSIFGVLYSLQLRQRVSVRSAATAPPPGQTANLSSA